MEVKNTITINNKTSKPLKIFESCKRHKNQEVEKEIDLIKKSGLQSIPNREKSDSSKKTSHSAVTERR